jgi:hypothetical protein
MIDPLRDLELPSAVLAQAHPLSAIGLKEGRLAEADTTLLGVPEASGPL